MADGKASSPKRKKDHAKTESDKNRDGLMEAMIGACAYVAHADGRLDQKERQRVFCLMRALPTFSGYPDEAITAAFARQERAFAVEPRTARKQALDAIEALKVREPEAHLFISACQHVLEADGVRLLSEYQALHDIGQALEGHAASAAPLPQG